MTPLWGPPWPEPGFAPTATAVPTAEQPRALDTVARIVRAADRLCEPGSYQPTYTLPAALYDAFVAELIERGMFAGDPNSDRVDITTNTLCRSFRRG